MKQSFEAFTEALLDVVAHPVVPLVRGRFFIWDYPGGERKLLQACPLTQVGLKHGVDVDAVAQSFGPEEQIVRYLLDIFDVERRELQFVWNTYDHNEPMESIIDSLATQRRIGK